MVLDLRNRPYDLDFLQDMEEIQLSLVQKYDLPFVTEGGRIYESYQELFQLELIQCGLLAEEDELLLKVTAGDVARHALTAVAGRSSYDKGAGRAGLKGDVKEAGEAIGGKVGEAADVVGGVVGPAREAVGEKIGEAKEAVGEKLGDAKAKAKEIRDSAPEKIEEGAEVVGQAAGVFAGKINNKARDIKAKMTSAATGLKVTGSALSRGFKAGLDSQKAPTSPIYKRSPKEYWDKRGGLATDKANADVNFNKAADEYEKNGDESAFEKATADYGASIAEVDRKAKEMGSSFEAVASHVEALGQGRTRGVMPPSDAFPDAATKSGEDGSGKALFDQTSKNLSGGLWSQKVKQRGEAWSQGKGKEESRFKGPGAEGEAAIEAAEAAEAADPGQEEAGLREALKDPDKAITNLPKGSNIDSGDREYLTKPGQQPPEGVQVHFGEPGAQGQRSRFYSKTEANIRRMARRQKAQGQADELGPEGEKSPEARKARAEQAKAGIEASPDPLDRFDTQTGEKKKGLGKVSDSDIDSFIQDLKDQGILKPGDEEKASKVLEEGAAEQAAPAEKPAAKPREGEQPRLPGFNGEAAEGEAAQARLPGFNGEDEQQKREDEIVAERDERREGGPASPETEPSKEPTPTPETPPSDEPTPTPEAPSGVPKNVQTAIDRAERLANQGGKVAAQYSRLVSNVDKFATQAANGDVRMDDKQVKGFLEVADGLTESANASREANKTARRKMTALTRTQTDLESVSDEVKTLQDALNAGDDVDKKELKDLKKQQQGLKKKRTSQVSDAQKAMGAASERKRALSDSMKGVRRNIQDIKDNPAPDAPSRNVGWRRLVNKQPEGSPIPNPELPQFAEGSEQRLEAEIKKEPLIDMSAAQKVLENEGWGEKEADAYIQNEMARHYEPEISDYSHPANAESDMGSKYVPRAIKAAQKMSKDPIITSAIAGGALKLSKDNQHLWEMLDMADEIIDKQLIDNGNYSPILFSIDSYLESYSYN